MKLLTKTGLLELLNEIANPYLLVGNLYITNVRIDPYTIILISDDSEEPMHKDEIIKKIKLSFKEDNSDVIREIARPSSEIYYVEVRKGEYSEGRQIKHLDISKTVFFTN